MGPLFPWPLRVWEEDPALGHVFVLLIVCVGPWAVYVCVDMFFPRVASGGLFEIEPKGKPQFGLLFPFYDTHVFAVQLVSKLLQLFWLEYSTTKQNHLSLHCQGFWLTLFAKERSTKRIFSMAPTSKLINL